MNNVGVIDLFLATLTTSIDSGFGLLKGEMASLSSTLIALDITLAALFWAWGADEDIVQRLVRKTLSIGFFAYLIGNFNGLADIALQEGERLAGAGPVAVGDTVRWIIGDTESGAEAATRLHILVKPTRPDIQTNLVINTDRRTYHLELRATAATYMASVSWQYPEDQLIALRRPNKEADARQPITSGVDIASLNFRYVIDGDDAPWKPLRAFDDGAKVYIEFPSGVAQGEMPPLFVVGPAGGPELVNYRVRGHHMIVDRVFAAAELRMGDENNQRRVRIRRIDGRRP